ncbi:peptidylprolyl isomerase [Pseudomonas koreensis]|jgi:peptidyl-prolyl cis-trans isomerase C|uniref:peptidylprolyl isomerase n=1 Tax=Pseudomonas koreensis TaxID=198620 RepID=UPI0009866DD3|nr:SurA N-terminal domain-containing protein [Pseudomonas koreensis]OOH81437.1 peptidylprolyl isomerase [Pseudomonas koreensis]WRH94196.1 SurA N-terminal domain-containing protein [Pseudomonas fluorescens]
MKRTTLILLLTCWLPQAWANNEPAVARVNGDEISGFRFERFFAEYLEDQGRAVTSIRSPKAYKELRQAALQMLIDKELLWQESQKRGRQIDEQALRQQIEQTRLAIGGTDKFVRRLQDAGFDEASFTEYTRRELAAQQMFAELIRANTLQPRHLLIRVPVQADAATVAQARLRLMQMRASIVSGASFASQPLRSPFGWHVIYLPNHLEAADVPDLQGLDTVRAQLARQQQTQARRQVLAQLRVQNRIERIDDD